MSLMFNIILRKPSALYPRLEILCAASEYSEKKTELDRKFMDGDGHRRNSKKLSMQNSTVNNFNLY